MFNFTQNHSILFLAGAIFILYLLWNVFLMNQKGKEKKKIIQERKDHISSLYDYVIQLDTDIFKILQRKERDAIDLIDWTAREEAVSNYKRLQRLQKQLADMDFSNMYYEEFVEYMENYIRRLQELLHDAEKIKVDDMKAAYKRAAEEDPDYSDSTEINAKSIILPGLSELSESRYFCMCHDISELQARYRLLAKLNHPDAGGNSEIFIKIKKDYEECRRLIKEKA